MKKVLIVLVAVLLVATMFAGCSSTPAAAPASASAPASGSAAGSSAASTASAIASATTSALASAKTAKAPKDTKVLFAPMTMEGDYWSIMDTTFKKLFTDGGYQYSMVSADMDALKQVEQIEDATQTGTDLIIIIPVQPTAVADACKSAMAKGTLVFGFINDTGDGARNCFRGVDQDTSAKTIVDMANSWVAKTFPNAADGSVNTVILGDTSTADQKTRYDSMQKYAAQNKALKVLEAASVESSTTQGQAMAENMFQKHPDIQLFLVASGDVAIGVNSFVTAPKSPVKDISKFGIFSSEIGAQQADLLKKADTNQSAYRGSAVSGGNIADNLKQIYDQCGKMLSGQSYNAIFPVDVLKVTSQNLKDVGY